MNNHAIYLYLYMILPIVAVVNVMVSANIILFGTPMVYVYSNLITYSIFVIIYFELFFSAFKPYPSTLNKIMGYVIRGWVVMFYANTLYGVAVLWPVAGLVMTAAKIVPEIVLSASLFLYVRRG